jgi:hypothetical protein
MKGGEARSGEKEKSSQEEEKVTHNTITSQTGNHSGRWRGSQFFVREDRKCGGKWGKT